MIKSPSNSLFHDIANTLCISMIISSYSSLFHDTACTLYNILNILLILIKNLSIPKLVSFISKITIESVRSMWESFQVLIKSFLVMIKSFLVMIKSFLVMIKSFLVMIKLYRITIESIKAMIKLFWDMIKSSWTIIKSFWTIINPNPCKKNSKYGFTSTFLVVVICLFISVSFLKLHCFLYASNSINTHYVSLLLILLNMIIFEFSKLSDHLWISTKQMSIPTIFVTLCFVFNSIFYVRTSLNERFISNQVKDLSSFVGHFSNYIDILVFVGVILLLVSILLHRYSKIFGPFFLYVIFFLIALVFSYIVLGSISIDDDTARYAISTLVQSEAAIFALVFSLSLVAMQQVASSYPPDVSKLFYTNNTIFFSTLMIYLISITFGVCVLIQIPHIPENSTVEIDQGSIRFTFLISIFALLSIFPFVKNTFNFLVPHKWIELLRNNRKYGIFSVENKDCTHILGILLNSLKKSDYDAVTAGLDYFEDYKMEFIDFQKNIIVPLEGDKRVKFGKSLYHLAHYFVDVGELSLKMGSTDDCTIKIIKNLYDIRKVADEYEMECVTSLTTESIGKLAKKAVCPLNYELNDKNPDNRECASFALGLLRNDFL